MKRRKFNTLLASATSSVMLTSFNNRSPKKLKKHKISLAQWSLNDTINAEKKLNPIDFAKKAHELGFDAIEYVSTFYNKFLEGNSTKKLTRILNQNSTDFNIKNLLIMVDGEGDLASSERSKIKKSVDKHKKWIEAAHGLGCHSIRVNLRGEENTEKWKENSTIGLTSLCEFANNFGINIIVENHGGQSSNGKALAEVMKNVNLKNCGTLPDFGNFCVKRKNNSRFGGECEIEYDKYQGVRDLMPYAKAVSAKSYDFDNLGEETTIDFKKMIDILKEFKYEGYIGIEYEGKRLSEIMGIELTKNLIQKYI